MPYSHTTLTTALALLASRLGDTDGVFWTSSERTYAIQEAIRFLNAITGTQRVRTQFTSAASTPFYDLNTVAGPTTYRASTIRDRAVVSQLQLHLLEPDSPGSWTGTAMFTLLDLTRALTRRRNLFLTDTHVVLTRDSAVSVAAHPALSLSRVALDEDYAAVHRAVWYDTFSKYTQLWPSDELAATGINRDWNDTASPPYAFSVVATPQLELQVIPYVATGGYLDLTVVALPADLDTTANAGVGTLMGIPDDFVHFVKYGALADLLSQDGPSRDPSRASWAEEIYQVGVRLARKAPVVLTAGINGQPVIPGSLSQLDALRPGWQGRSAAAPTTVAVASNLVALSPVPRDATVTVTLDLVRSAVVPAAGGDALQCRKDQLDAVLGWAEHYCLLKCAGSEWQMSALAGSRLMRAATSHLEQQITQSQYLAELYRLTTAENIIRPYVRTQETEQQFMTAADQARAERLRDSARGGR